MRGAANVSELELFEGDDFGAFEGRVVGSPASKGTQANNSDVVVLH